MAGNFRRSGCHFRHASVSLAIMTGSALLVGALLWWGTKQTVFWGSGCDELDA